MKKTLKTKLFGTKIKGETLKHLMHALGSNYNEHRHRENGWTNQKLTGKAHIRPTEKGIQVRLNLTAKDMHVVFGPNGRINKIDYSINRNYSILKGIIPYKIEEKTK